MPSEYPYTSGKFRFLFISAVCTVFRGNAQSLRYSKLKKKTSMVALELEVGSGSGVLKTMSTINKVKNKTSDKVLPYRHQCGLTVKSTSRRNLRLKHFERAKHPMIGLGSRIYTREKADSLQAIPMYPPPTSHYVVTVMGWSYLSTVRLVRLASLQLLIFCFKAAVLLQGKSRF